MMSMVDLAAIDVETIRIVTRRDYEVVDFTRSRVKNNNKFTNLRS